MTAARPADEFPGANRFADIMNSIPLPPPNLQILAAGLSLVLAAALSLLMIRINIADLPNERSAHQESIPRAGGVAIAVPFVLLITGLQSAGYVSSPAFGAVQPFVWIGAAVALYGFVDDVHDLSVPLKLMVQMSAAILFTIVVAPIDRLWFPQIGMVEFGWLGYPLTVFWIVGFMNAFNCLDGIDGLAGGGALIALLFLGLIAHSTGSQMVLLPCILLLPAVLGFMYFNFPRARLFMGDTGSQFLGFVLAGLAVIGSSVEEARISFYVVPIIFYTFVFDFVVTLAIRLFRKQAILTAHRGFMFQIWHRAGWPAPRICLIYFTFLVLNGAVAMIAQWGDPLDRLYLVVALAIPHGVLAWTVYQTGRRAGL